MGSLRLVISANVQSISNQTCGATLRHNTKRHQSYRTRIIANSNKIYCWLTWWYSAEEVFQLMMVPGAFFCAEKTHNNSSMN